MRSNVSKKQFKKTRPKKHGLSQAQVVALTDLTLKLGQPLCIAEGIELIHVECHSEPRGQVLRLYIDKPGGVKLDDCVNISRQIGDLLDVQTEQETAYLLEVSSPGPDRPLGKPDDFSRFTGHQARVRMAAPINGQKNVTGILAGMQNGIVTLRMKDTSIAIPLSHIKHARLIGYQGES